MRTSTPLVVVALVACAAAACSRSKRPNPGNLDLMLGDNTRATHVVSPVEIWGDAKARLAAPAPSGLEAPAHAHRAARTRHLALVPRRAPRAERVLGVAVREPQPQPRIAVAPAPAPAPRAEPAPAPEPAPQPDPEPVSRRGGWSEDPNNGGGIHIPGFPGGGVIIIRGGHGGMDPCDEHGHGGIFPGLPGRMGGGRWGGIRF